MFPEISIIMPVYNGEKYLKQTLDSVAQQTYRDYELIAVDDGSTDSSAQILRSYEDSIKIRVFSQENQGVSNARNRGIREAQGRFLCFLDADDCMHPQMLDCLYAMIIKYNADLVYCEYMPFYGDHCHFAQISDMDTNETEPENLCARYGLKTFDYMMKEGYGTALWNKLIRRDLITEYHLLFTEGAAYGEDMFFNWKVVLLCDCVIPVREKLYGYRQNAQGASVRFHADLYEQYIEEYRKILLFGECHGCDTAVLEASVDENLLLRVPSFLRMNIRSHRSVCRKLRYLKELRKEDRIERALFRWMHSDEIEIPRREAKLLHSFAQGHFLRVFLQSLYGECRIQAARRIKR